MLLNNGLRVLQISAIVYSLYTHRECNDKVQIRPGQVWIEYFYLKLFYFALYYLVSLFAQK